MRPAQVGTRSECISNIKAFSGHLNEVPGLLGGGAGRSQAGGGDPGGSDAESLSNSKFRCLNIPMLLLNFSFKHGPCVP